MKATKTIKKLKNSLVNWFLFRRITQIIKIEKKTNNNKNRTCSGQKS